MPFTHCQGNQHQDVPTKGSMNKPAVSTLIEHTMPRLLIAQASLDVESCRRHLLLAKMCSQITHSMSLIYKLLVVCRPRTRAKFATKTHLDFIRALLQ